MAPAHSVHETRRAEQLQLGHDGTPSRRGHGQARSRQAANLVGWVVPPSAAA